MFAFLKRKAFIKLLKVFFKKSFKTTIVNYVLCKLAHRAGVPCLEIHLRLNMGLLEVLLCLVLLNIEELNLKFPAKIFC